MTSLPKDVGEIWSRLFDHRPFVQGEVKFFLKEFEEKREDREVERIFKVLEQVAEIKDYQVDKIKNSSGNQLSILNSNLEVTVGMCESILEKGEEEESVDVALLVKREGRKAEWEAFIRDMGEKCARVDKTFKEREEELSEYYKQLEQKLHLTEN